MTNIETVCDSDLIGEQMGKAVSRTVLPKCISRLENFLDQFPEDTKDPKFDQLTSIYLAGQVYLKFWGRKDGATAVEFESLGEKFLIGKRDETDPKKIINWNKRVLWADGRTIDPLSRYYLEASCIGFLHSEIKQSEIKITGNKN